MFPSHIDTVMPLFICLLISCLIFVINDRYFFLYNLLKLISLVLALVLIAAALFRASMHYIRIVSGIFLFLHRFTHPFMIIHSSPDTFMHLN